MRLSVRAGVWAGGLACAGVSDSVFVTGCVYICACLREVIQEGSGFVFMVGFGWV